MDALGGIDLDVGGRVPMGGGTNLDTGEKNPILGWIEPGTQRAAYLEGLARSAVAPSGAHGVLQLTGHEPVAVPQELLRASDGRPRFRPHMDEHYATAAHLAQAGRGPDADGYRAELARLIKLAEGLAPAGKDVGVR